MDRFEAMHVFAKVVEVGSFAGAAERLDLSTSAVSRHIAQLETHLDARLLNRTTRRISLTDTGRAYYERCVQLLADLEETEALAGSQNATLRGTLRLTAAVSLGVSHLAPAIAAFSAQHPALGFDVMLSDRQVDLVEEGLDLAIRVGEVGSQNLIARTIGQARLMLCAAPAYLARHGTPQSPDELVGHACLTYAYSSDSNVWRFQRAGAQPQRVRINGPIHANSGPMLAELASQGMGITFAPDFILRPHVQAGRLLTVLGDWEPPPLPIWAVYPSRRHLSAKVRAFVPFLSEWLARACMAKDEAGAIAPPSH